MGTSAQKIVIFLAFLPVVFAAGVAVVRFKQLAAPLRYLGCLVFFSLLIEIGSRILWLYKVSNLFLLPLYTIVEFGLIAWVYWLALRQYAVARWIPRLLVSFVLCTGVLVAWEGFGRFNDFQRLIESVLILGFVIAYFYKVFQETVIVRLEHEPLFWFSSGLFIYFSGNTFIFILSNYLLSYSVDLNYQAWIIHAMLNVVLYVFYSIALWIRPRS
jgi:hypothetical protein